MSTLPWLRASSVAIGALCACLLLSHISAAAANEGTRLYPPTPAGGYTGGEFKRLQDNFMIPQVCPTGQVFFGFIGGPDASNPSERGKPSCVSNIALSGSAFIGGNVGIGTSNPAALLDVTGWSSNIAFFRNTNPGGFPRLWVVNDQGQGLFFQVHGSAIASSGSLNMGPGGAYIMNNNSAPFAIGTQTSQPLIFAQGNSETMRITGNGNVGIGTDSPTEKLTVAGAGNFGGQLSANDLASRGGINVSGGGYFGGIVQAPRVTGIALPTDGTDAANKNYVDTAVAGVSGQSCVKYVQVAPAQHTTCALRSDGTVWCFGNSDRGRMGYGGDQNLNFPSIQKVAGLWNVARIQSKGAELGSCALKTNGTLWCWGHNHYQRISTRNPAIDGSIIYAPYQSTDFTDIVDFSVGYHDSCVVRSDGSLWCWGLNNYGQLGLGDTARRQAPVRVISSGVTWVAQTIHSMCALLSNGAVKCTGRNDGGYLGDNTPTQRLSPVTVSFPTTTSPVVQIAAYGEDTRVGWVCALKQDGTVWCWWEGAYGMLGNWAQSQQNRPVQVIGITNAAQIDGGYQGFCARLTDGGVKCWGDGNEGEMGNGITSPRENPTPVSTVINNVSSIGVGMDTTCAVRTDGRLMCWGYNAWYNAGNQTSNGANVTIPAIVAPGDDYCLSEGAVPACMDGIDNDGNGVADDADNGCWRANATGQIDRNNRANYDPFDTAEDAPACLDNRDNDGDGVRDADDGACWQPTYTTSTYVEIDRSNATLFKGTTRTETSSLPIYPTRSRTACRADHGVYYRTDGAGRLQIWQQLDADRIVYIKGQPIVDGRWGDCRSGWNIKQGKQFCGFLLFNGVEDFGSAEIGGTSDPHARCPWQ